MVIVCMRVLDMAALLFPSTLARFTALTA